MAALCCGCPAVIGRIFQTCFENNEASTAFLRAHGVLPSTEQCPRCGKDCIYRKDKHLWRCNGSTVIPKTKKRRRCNYTISDYHGSFLERVKLQPWQIVIFVYYWVQKTFKHSIVLRNVQISLETSVDWRSFCSEVCEHWFNNQEAIGGDSVVVEIDETLVVRKKYNKGRDLIQTWLFGGIERTSKKSFVVPLLDPLSNEIQKRNKATLVPLIKKYIKPGSIIISDCWSAYVSLTEEGYTHYSVNHSEHFVDPHHPEVHTQNIERYWRDIRSGLNDLAFVPATCASISPDICS